MSLKLQRDWIAFSVAEQHLFGRPKIGFHLMSLVDDYF